MGTKGRKAKKPAGKQSNAGKLQKLIEDVIQAEDRGDPDRSRQAVRALDKFGEQAGSEPLRHVAVEARMAAQHDVAVDRRRRLREIRERLDNV